MEWVVLYYMLLLEGFADVDIVGDNFVGHCEALGREEFGSIFELIDFKFSP